MCCSLALVHRGGGAAVIVLFSIRYAQLHTINLRVAICYSIRVTLVVQYIHVGIAISNGKPVPF